MKLLFKNLKRISKTETVKDTVIVFSGQLASTLTSALFFFLIARVLGPEKLGVYSTLAAIVIIITDTIDLALNSSIVKFINSKNSDAYLKFAFFLKNLAGILFLGLLFASSGFISLVLHQELSYPLRVAAIFAFVLLLFRFPKAVFQGKKEFVNDAALDVSVGSLRLFIVLIFIFTGNLSIVNIFWAHISSTFIVFLAGVRKVSFKFLRGKVDEEVRKKFFSFQSWLTLGFVLAAIHSRIDTLFLMRFSGPAMVGFYQAGYRFFLPIIQFSSVLSTVFAPRFASFENETQVRTYLKKSALLSAAFGILTWFFIPFVPLAINIFYGSAYKASILPTQILTVGFGVFVFAVPFISCLLYRWGKTKIFALMNIIQFIMLVFLDIVLIPRLAALGAALAASLTLIVVNFIAIFWVIKGQT